VYIQTLNNDKNATNNWSFVVDRPVTLYVTMSAAYRNMHPAWLNGWTPLAELITTNETSGEPLRIIYRKAFPAGKITLGPNHDGKMPAGPSMYNVMMLTK
jgi:hypothetical protein